MLKNELIFSHKEQSTQNEKKLEKSEKRYS